MEDKDRFLQKTDTICAYADLFIIRISYLINRYLLKWEPKGITRNLKGNTHI